MRSCIRTPFTYLFLFFLRSKNVRHVCSTFLCPRSVLENVVSSLSVCPARRSQIDEPIKRLKQKRKKEKKKEKQTVNGRYSLRAPLVQQTRMKKKKKTSKKKKTEKFEKKKLLKAMLTLSVSLRNVQTSKVSLVESFSAVVLYYNPLFFFYSFSFPISREHVARRPRTNKTFSVNTLAHFPFTHRGQRTRIHAHSQRYTQIEFRTRTQTQKEKDLVAQAHDFIYGI